MRSQTNSVLINKAFCYARIIRLMQNELSLLHLEFSALNASNETKG